METAKPHKRSHVSVKRKGDPLPLPVVRALKKLGADLALARRRRRLTQASMAERIQTSVATLRRMEHGDERISIGTIAQAFLVLGELDKINGLIDSAADTIGLTLMNQQLPQRVRNKRVTPESGAL
ncbi:helix-turn-helix transcriptional regulator [Paraburkholderia sediminicola]|uniref:helix-turn-helix domain-containing protein n=1 Tax=Paraburkholderia sediminicola TaxID=458836 RepID=UPI0038BE07E7